MSAFDLVHNHIARQLAPKPCQPAVAQATPLASADDIREAIEVLTDDIREAIEVLTIEAYAQESVGTLSAMARADQLRRVIKLLRATLHRLEG